MILILRSFCRFLTPEHNFVETVTKGILVVFQTNWRSKHFIFLSII